MLGLNDTFKTNRQSNTCRDRWKGQEENRHQSDTRRHGVYSSTQQRCGSTVPFILVTTSDVRLVNESFSGVGSFFNELVELVHRACLNDSFTNRTESVKRLTDLVFINYFSLLKLN